MSRTSSARISRPPKTEQHKLQGVVELTSIINMIDLENQHREAMAAKQATAQSSAPMQLPPDELQPRSRAPAAQRRPMRPQGLTGQPPARGPEQEQRTVRGQAPVARAPAPRAPAPPAPSDPRDALPTVPR